MFQYRALVVDVHDGDTYTLDVDLGLQVWLRGQKLRLAHANAPELATDAGKTALAWVLSRMPPGSHIVIDTTKAEGDREKYGRWLAQVTLSDGTDLASEMIRLGYAVTYEGGPRQ